MMCRKFGTSLELGLLVGLGPASLRAQTKDASMPRSTPAADWVPKGLCTH